MITPHDLIVRNVFVSCVLIGLLASSGVTPVAAQVLPPIIDPTPGSTLTTTPSAVVLGVAMGLSG